MTLKNNRAPLPYFVKLCTSFQSHGWIRTRVTVWKRSIRVKIGKCLWPWNLMDDLEKTIGHLFYNRSSYVHHFQAIGEFKLVLQSGNAQFGSKSAIFCLVWSLKIDGWLWRKYGTSSILRQDLCIISKPSLDSNCYSREGNAQFVWKFVIFFCPTWLRNLTDGPEKQKGPLSTLLCNVKQKHDRWWERLSEHSTPLHQTFTLLQTVF